MEVLSLAVAEIHQRAGKVTAKSSIYETAAWGKADQPSFLNQVVEINTKLLPDQLLSVTQAIETGLGRKRKERWGPRIIDIDILFYGDHIINLPDLIIPHPAIAERRFTLVPMNEIAPMWIHPLSGATMEQLLARCEDSLEVVKTGK